MRPVVSFNKVVKEYNGQRVLSSLSFEVRPKEVVGLLGRSGIGKTTILKLTAGLEKATRGKVEVKANQVGYVFQEPRLFPWKTSLDNVALPLRAMGLNKRTARNRASDYLASVGLAEFNSYYPAQLSGGMKQRVSLARAFAVEPDLLLLDEPFSALDIELRNSLIEMVAGRLAGQPTAVLYVSHSPREVAKLATRVLMMHSGSALQRVDLTHCAALEPDQGETAFPQLEAALA